MLSPTAFARPLPFFMNTDATGVDAKGNRGSSALIARTASIDQVLGDPVGGCGVCFHTIGEPLDLAISGAPGAVFVAVQVASVGHLVERGTAVGRFARGAIANARVFGSGDAG